MSLSKDRLGNALADRVITIMGGSAPGAADETELRTLMKALADEIIKEFIANAVIESDGATAVHASGAAANIEDLAGVIKS